MKEKIFVTRPLLPPLEEYVNELRDIWDARFLTNAGPKHQKLEAELKDYLGVENISLFSNGHMALQVAIRALGLKGEIITTPFTYASTTHAIAECGCTPVFCDIDPVTLTMDVKKAEQLITDRTVALLPVHVYGTVCDVEALQKLANKHSLKLIYDAAHTFGVKVGDKGIGTFGDISMFSFHATKVYNTVEGGCLTYSDPSLKEKIEAIHAFGFKSGSVNADYVGTNAKMTEVSAAMGLCNLRHVDKAIESRRRTAEIYDSMLSGIDGITLLHKQSGVETNYAYYPVLFCKEKCGINRDEAAEALKRDDIFARKYFYPLTSDFNCYKGKFDRGVTPTADKAAENVLVLPLYAGLSDDDAKRICNIILNEVS